MKRITLTITMLCAFCGLAFAGPEPLPSGKEVLQPAPPPPTSCFDGFYFGVQGAGVLQSGDNDLFSEVTIIGPQGGNTFTAFDRGHDDDDQFGWGGGLHVGYNMARGSWVFGAEVDANGTDFDLSNGKADAFVNPPGQSYLEAFVRSDSNVDWYGTARLRMGHTFGQRIMAFATGGLAVVSADIGAKGELIVNRGQGTGLVSIPFKTSDDDIQLGWTVGGGFDFCLSDHWILNLTYLYMDVGDQGRKLTYEATSPNGKDSFFATVAHRSDLTFHVLQGGLSFKF
jgi:outer membrane immunogenic protein